MIERAPKRVSVLRSSRARERAAPRGHRAPGAARHGTRLACVLHQRALRPGGAHLRQIIPRARSRPGTRLCERARRGRLSARRDGGEGRARVGGRGRRDRDAVRRGVQRVRRGGARGATATRARSRSTFAGALVLNGIVVVAKAAETALALRRLTGAVVAGRGTYAKASAGMRGGISGAAEASPQPSCAPLGDDDNRDLRTSSTMHRSNRRRAGTNATQSPRRRVEEAQSTPSPQAFALRDRELILQ